MDVPVHNFRIVSIYSLGSNKNQRNCDGRGARSTPLGRGNAPKKTGARSARARTRGQNPLVINISFCSIQYFYLDFVDERFQGVYQRLHDRDESHFRGF
jgi:hypothetical protein